MKVAIIGAGIGSLATSIRLAHAGHEVHVYEANSYAGGKLHSFALGEYRFDGGPSLFTMPHYVTELFDLCGKRPADYFEYQKLDEACRYFWTDGTKIYGYADPNAFAKEVSTKLPIAECVLESYFNHVQDIYELSGKTFLEKSLHQASTWLSKDTLNALARLGEFDLFKSMHAANKTRLQEPHLVQLFDRFATYNGSNPYQAPGILNVIPWFEHGFGTFAPKGGMRAIPNALQSLAEELGVKFHFNAEVEKIDVKNGVTTGLMVNGQHVSSDSVVSNADVYFTYHKLMPEQKAPHRILNQERSSSAVVFYWGMNRAFDELSLHNILFSNNYEEEFNDLFKRKRFPENPTVYINVSSKVSPEDAPKNCENWFVMVNAPAFDGQVVEDDVLRLKKRVVQHINHTLGVQIESHIEQEKIWTPKDIESDTRSYQGALYGNSSNGKLAAFLRHPNFSKRIKNLYFCGGSVHPGGGIPLALLSAKITADFILNANKN